MLDAGGVRDGVTGVVVAVSAGVRVASSYASDGVGVRIGVNDLQDMSKMAKIAKARFMAGIIAVKDEVPLTLIAAGLTGWYNGVQACIALMILKFGGSHVSDVRAWPG